MSRYAGVEPHGLRWSGPNKFLAKIASDWKKPNGLFVIQPHEVQSFLLPLPVGRIPGVGQVTERRMKAVGIATVGDHGTTLQSRYERRKCDR
ncbi:MAG TPA: hypothetical protein VK608_03640 [Edaphobacter sp.]|nr:hypothetical protein [Edaphobacter sp.]